MSNNEGEKLTVFRSLRITETENDRLKAVNSIEFQGALTPTRAAHEVFKKGLRAFELEREKLAAQLASVKKKANTESKPK